ncbi:DUF2461 domain-containing protein [Maribacter sp.]|uniref:DUF2461 domain-containing protein n=1 Tax=Maribacter sp. TaxID=1897614 RepID=UPI0025B98F8B|nr:DUF2461 domain-containing protein [Maribacter sp.]
MSQLSKSSFDFLKKLEKNNNREWFKENKPMYDAANEDAKAFLGAVEDTLNTFDQIEKKKLFRIYRDVRFSKDKTPYSTSFRMSLGREGAFRRGGYYIKLEPGGSMIGGGFYNPNPGDIKLIRSHIAADDKPLRKILKSKKFKATFGELMGDQVKSAPKGFSKDHPAIDLLRYKAMYVFKEFSDKEVLAPTFLKEVKNVYKTIQPFFNYMTEILTHDLDGVPLYK